MPGTALSLPPLPAGLMALPGVYRPQPDTLLLAEALDHEELGPQSDVLEIGTGTGALALQAAATGARVMAVDVSWPAVVTARLNSLRRRLPVHVLHGDFAERTAGRRFDLVVANPPYVPAPEVRLPSHGPQRAWDAGPDGRAVLDRICGRAPVLLRPGGVLLLVHSEMCRAEETLESLARAGLAAEVTAKASVPWGPVLRSRRSWLERQGLAAEAQEWEELVIIRARPV
ncbi:methyltransferase [Streptomyces sp. ZAF1911]|uniref:HemK2/MTQ2 family protein methyltransferase n=1 Tax=Streptomyces sp. ZAF1911 TaxID=2944129 RepID=UPI00237A6C71|nr:HemK2/MTQ2 family protein methyltransferase [Streptomyces sp. ZAF1911]MDD9375681.1 methyltransferase [Streptomyces sp. ZAF1911]